MKVFHREQFALYGIYYCYAYPTLVNGRSVSIHDTQTCVTLLYTNAITMIYILS